jgi:hypothetical protein
MNGKTRSYSSSPLYEQPPKKKINILEKNNRDDLKNNLSSTVTSNEDDVFLPDDNASLQNAQHTTANIFADLTHSISLDKDGNDTRGKYSGISTPSPQLSLELTENHSHSTGDIEFSDSIANQHNILNLPITVSSHQEQISLASCIGGGNRILYTVSRMLSV